MNPETLTALKASIQHWEELSNIASLDDANIGPLSCDLCGLFNTSFQNVNATCIGCPVFEHTGLRTCSQTPWWNVYYSLVGGDLPNFLIDAKKELTFLRSLLPTDGQ